MTARSTSRITTFVLGSTLACSLYVQGGPVQVPTPVPTSLKATQLSVDGQGKVVAKTTPYEGRDAAEQFGHLKNHLADIDAAWLRATRSRTLTDALHLRLQAGETRARLYQQVAAFERDRRRKSLDDLATLTDAEFKKYLQGLVHGTPGDNNRVVDDLEFSDGDKIVSYSLAPSRRNGSAPSVFLIDRYSGGRKIVSVVFERMPDKEEITKVYLSYPVTMAVSNNDDGSASFVTVRGYALLTTPTLDQIEIPWGYINPSTASTRVEYRPDSSDHDKKILNEATEYYKTRLARVTDRCRQMLPDVLKAAR